RGEVAVADVRDGLGPEALRDDAHRLDGDVELLGSRVDRRLVDLGVLGTGALEGLRLLPHDLRARERRVAAGPVRLVVRPVEHRVGTGEHPLHGAVGEALREAVPLDGQGLRPPDLRCDDRLVVVAIAVRPDESADLEAIEPLGEVRDHVAAVHLAVHEDVESDGFLAPDPLLGRLAFELEELAVRERAARGRVARLLQVVRLPEGADRGREQNAADARTPPAVRGASASAFSFFTARSWGRYSRPVVVESQSRSAGTFFNAASTSSPSSRGVSSRVLRASTIPSTTVRVIAPMRSIARADVSRLRTSTPSCAIGNAASASTIASTGKKYGCSASATPAVARRSNAARARSMCSGCAARAGSSTSTRVAPADLRPRSSAASASATPSVRRSRLL